VAYKNENKDQGQISSFLSVVCGPMPSCFVLCIDLVFEGNVVERRISKWGHLDLNFPVNGAELFCLEIIPSYFVCIYIGTW